MVNGDGRAWYPSDPERFQARFRTVHQLFKIMELKAKTPVDGSDLQAYMKEQPEEARKVQNMNTIGQLSGMAAVLGFIGSTTSIWRWSKTVPLVIVGGAMAPFAAALVVEDVASLALGTFKFDNYKATEDFLTWANKRRENRTEQ